VPETVQKYRLCGFCIERQGEGHGVFEEVEGQSCHLCGGLLDRIPLVADRSLRDIRRYQFRNFSVGIALPEGVQEREDELRADMKLMGKETVKTQAARMFAKRVSSRLRKPVEKMKPDLTILVGMTDEKVTVSTRPLFFYGRYSKPSGIKQKMELCAFCRGPGCAKCGQTGLERKQSVEAQLRKRLETFSGTGKMTFTWIGSEDEASRVFPPGRPFVVELKNPVKRDLPRRFVCRFRGSQVSVSKGKLLPSRPLRLPSFRFRTEIKCRMAAEVDEVLVGDVRRRFRRSAVRFDRPHNRPTTKMVYSASAEKHGRKLVLDVVMDGGLPVKRFVSGELVSPSVSEVLKTEVRCRTFDICEVKETGKFSYAGITRV